MDLLFLLYPMTAFVYLRLALAALARWASRGRWTWLALACLAMAGTIDSAFRLFEVAAIAPYWWVKPLVAFALVYVWFRTAQKHWQKLAIPTASHGSHSSRPELSSEGMPDS